MIEISFNVNSQSHRVSVEPSLSLLDLLRNHLGYKGVKICCNTGECGACTILFNGQPVNSCVVLAADANESQLVTVEGITQDGKLHPVQEAFIEAGAVQCGYCTPGFIMSAKALLDLKPNPTLEEIKEAISGNICRCTGYTKIIRAIQLAAQRHGGK